MCDPIVICFLILETILTFIPLSAITAENFKVLSYIDEFEKLRIKINFDDKNNRFLYLTKDANVNKEENTFDEYLLKYNLKEGDLFTDNKDIKDALNQTYNKTVTFIVFSILFIISPFISVIYSFFNEIDFIFAFLMISNFSFRTLVYLILTIVDGKIKGITTFTIDFGKYYLDHFYGVNNDFYNYYLVIFELNKQMLIFYILLTIFNTINTCIYCYHFNKIKIIVIIDC